MNKIVPRKCIHLSLLTDTHAGLKRTACDLHMTMQSVMEELAQLVVQGDPRVMSHLRDVVRRRREEELVSLHSTDADTILDELELVASVQARLARRQISPS